MQFHDHLTVFDISRRQDPRLDKAEFYRAALNSGQHKVVAGVPNPQAEMYLRVGVELAWDRDGKPYYNIWPGMLNMLLTLDLNKVPMTYLRMPLGGCPLLIRLPACVDDPRLKGEDGQKVTSLLVVSSDDSFDGTLIRKFVTVVNFAGDQQTQLMVQSCPLDRGWTVEKFFGDTYPSQEGYNGMTAEELLRVKVFNRYIMSLVVSVCLIGQDPDLLTPDVLSKDREKFGLETDPTKLQAIVDRAHRRGKKGWDLGKGVEALPHWRRPHPALVWTGKGRHEPKIVFRKGSIVHREKIVEVPTGYGVDEEVAPVA